MKVSILLKWIVSKLPFLVKIYYTSQPQLDSYMSRYVMQFQ